MTCRTRAELSGEPHAAHTEIKLIYNSARGSCGLKSQQWEKKQITNKHLHVKWSRENLLKNHRETEEWINNSRLYSLYEQALLLLCDHIIKNKTKIFYWDLPACFGHDALHHRGPPHVSDSPHDDEFLTSSSETRNVGRKDSEFLLLNETSRRRFHK